MVGDLQIPYEDKRAVALWFKVMKWWKPASIDTVGDIDDQLEYSTFSDGTTDEFFNQLKVYEKDNEKAVAAYDKAVEKAGQIELGTGEILEITPKPELHDLNPLPFIKKNAQGAKSFYSEVRKQHKNADIHAHLGNHDIRIFKYIDKKDDRKFDRFLKYAVACAAPGLDAAQPRGALVRARAADRLGRVRCPSSGPAGVAGIAGR